MKRFRRSVVTKTRIPGPFRLGGGIEHSYLSIALIVTVFVGLILFNQSIADEEKEEPAYEPSKFFRTQILPILEKRCYECHSEEEECDDGGLVLDTKAGWVEGGDHGPAVVPYDLKKSSLIRTVRSNGGNQMPPEEKLTEGEIALLSTWVLLGAPDPRPK